MKIKGSIVALVTPFNEDKSIDYNSLDNLINIHLSKGTNALLFCGTTGEAATLTNEEYGEVIEFAVKQVQGKIPVIAGTGSNSTENTISKTKIAQQSGVDAALIVCPYYNKPSDTGIKAHFEAVSQASSIPLILYNVPSRTGKNMSAELILELSEINNIIGVKEASDNIDQITEILKKKNSDFNLYSGDDILAYSMNLMGADGCISVVANIIPEDFSKMMNLSINGETTESKKLYFKYLDLMKYNFLESNPIPVKTTLFYMSLIKEEFRMPLCKMENSEKQNILKEELIKLNLINQ